MRLPKRISAVALAIALSSLASIASAVPSFAEEASQKIADQVLAETQNGAETTFIIYLDDQADLSAAMSIKDSDARGWYVYNTLVQHAARTQAPVKAALDASGVAYTSYWAVNMILAEGDRGDVIQMASRADVATIEPDTAIEGIFGDEGVESTDEGNETAAIETGITNTTSPTLWNLGFKGQGIVVANQDTGMRWTHNSLRTHYRGWGGSIATSNHNYNWHDSIHARITNADGGTPSGPAANSCGFNLLVPCDDQGHGTHTTGTAVGDDGANNQIGVAPQAQWIGCRNMDAGNGRASTYTECFQFFLAPTDLNNQNADPTKRPHVVNNSWGCPQVGELCAPNVMKTIVENSVAAGIFIEASAGNDGSACNTVKDPPAIYGSAFSTGSISGTTNALSSFSSRGSVTADGSGRMKPDLVAPGASVRSSLRTSDTAYGSMSGTSMAGPHVVGVVALLWSARPNLVRDVPRTEWLLTRSANKAGITVPNNSAGCGGIAGTPNNHFGWGRVDATAAYNLEPSLYQTISFTTIPDRLSTDAPTFQLSATASSGLPVSYSATGSCSVSGDTVEVTGVGPCTVTAAQAGLDEYSIDPNAPKPWYPAEDVAQTFNVAWPFSGFNQPVDNGKLNDAKAGSAIPVKFSLDSDHGLEILADGSPASQRVTCDTNAAVDAIEETVTAGGSSLSFGGNQYVYVWKTDKSWAGTCRELVLTLDDATVHKASFRFK